MQFDLEFEGRKSVKLFEALPPYVQKRIFEAINRKLLKDPYHYGIPLKGLFHGLFKFRVGDYRVIFKIEKENLLIVLVVVENRKNVYEYLRRKYRK